MCVVLESCWSGWLKSCTILALIDRVVATYAVVFHAVKRVPLGVHIAAFFERANVVGRNVVQL